MSETGQAEKDRRYARINALTDGQRRALLAYLCGYAPRAVDTMLDVLDAEYVRQHGGDDLETGHTRDPKGEEIAAAGREWTPLDDLEDR